MTPTEQDKELREQIGDIFARACKNNEYFGNDGWYELHTPTLRAEIQSLITADRKRVALEAKIDENKRWLTALAPSMDENVAYNSDFHSRIAELKAQQEEV